MFKHSNLSNTLSNKITCQCSDHQTNIQCTQQDTTFGLWQVVAAKATMLSLLWSKVSSKATALTVPTTKKKKDAPTTQDAKVEDPHGKKPAGRKTPPVVSRKPSAEPTRRNSRRNKKKDAVRRLQPLLFQQCQNC